MILENKGKGATLLLNVGKVLVALFR